MTSSDAEFPRDLLIRQFSTKVASLLTPEQQEQAADVFHLLANAEDDATARAWMIGTNPHLGDENPILTIADGRSAEVRAAARAYLKEVWA